MPDTPRSDTPRLRSWLLATALVWMAITNGSILWNTRVEIRRGYSDFASFYTAGTLVRRGRGAELYNHKTQWSVQQEFASEVKIRQGPLPYIRPPFEALLFSVFAAWPYLTALFLWTCLKLALLAAIPFVVVRRRSWQEHIPLWAVGLLTLGTFPEFKDLLMGQDAPLLAFLFAIAYWQLATDRDVGAGVALGLALFKFHLVIPFVVALWIARRQRVLLGFAASAFLVLALSVGVVGWRGLLQYPRYLLALNQASGVGLVTPESQMNLRGLLIFVVGRVSYPGRIHWLLAPVALAAIVYAGRLWRKAGDHFLAEGFGLAMTMAIVTSYYAYDFDLVSLMVPLVAMWAGRADAPPADRGTRYLQAGGLFLLLLMPLYWFMIVQLKAECLMTLPMLAVGAALARTLRLAGGAGVGGKRKVLTPEGPR
jgi:hypothetical protein